MNEKSLELFKKLTEWPAAPGFEKSLQAYMIERLKDHSDEIVKDRMGGAFGVKRGDSEGPRVMVAGHMDEVGFMVTALTDQGLIRFQALGGWSSQVLSAQRVQIITDDGRSIIGVITSTPPHLLSEAERNKAADIKTMLIDVGADHREDLESMGIRPGLQIVPVSPFQPLANPKKILAKAWDNRYGVGLAIELMEEITKQEISLPNTLYAGATVQEEVGLRGAGAAAALIQPDLFFALDCSPANDTSGTPQAFGRLGEGVLLRILDGTMVTHQGMVDFIRDTAETHKIPYQYFVSAGGTDAGKVHLHHTGVPSAVIGICGRYIHTHASIIHTDDYAAAKELLVHLVKSADKSTLDTLIS